MGSGVLSILFNSISGHSYWQIFLKSTLGFCVCFIDVLELSRGCVVAPDQFNC